MVPEKPKADTEEVMDTRSQAKWADLLKRSFAIDIMTCASCGGRLKMIATITDPRIVCQILRHLGLPTEVPVRAPARAPPQVTIDTVAQDDLSQIPPRS